MTVKGRGAWARGSLTVAIGWRGHPPLSVLSWSLYNKRLTTNAIFRVVLWTDLSPACLPVVVAGARSATRDGRFSLLWASISLGKKHTKDTNTTAAAAVNDTQTIISISTFTTTTSTSATRVRSSFSASFCTDDLMSIFLVVALRFRSSTAVDVPRY